MPDYSWPDAEHRTLIGKRISRVDSPLKVSGRAKYTYDYHGTGHAFRQDRALSLRQGQDRQHRYQRRREDARREGGRDHPETRHDRAMGRR